MDWIRGRQHQIPACPFHKQLNNKLTQHFSRKLECFFHALKGGGQSTMHRESPIYHYNRHLDVWKKRGEKA